MEVKPWICGGCENIWLQRRLSVGDANEEEEKKIVLCWWLIKSRTSSVKVGRQLRWCFSAQQAIKGFISQLRMEPSESMLKLVLVFCARPQSHGSCGIKIHQQGHFSFSLLGSWMMSVLMSQVQSEVPFSPPPLAQSRTLKNIKMQPHFKAKVRLKWN